MEFQNIRPNENAGSEFSNLFLFLDSIFEYSVVTQ